MLDAFDYELWCWRAIIQTIGPSSMSLIFKKQATPVDEGKRARQVTQSDGTLPRRRRWIALHTRPMW